MMAIIYSKLYDSKNLKVKATIKFVIKLPAMLPKILKNNTLLLFNCVLRPIFTQKHRSSFFLSYKAQVPETLSGQLHP